MRYNKQEEKIKKLENPLASGEIGPSSSQLTNQPSFGSKSQPPFDTYSQKVSPFGGDVLSSGLNVQDIKVQGVEAPEKLSGPKMKPYNVGGISQGLGSSSTSSYSTGPSSYSTGGRNISQEQT